MQHSLEDDWTQDTDLDSTSELPILDVAAYEARVAARDGSPLPSVARERALAGGRSLPGASPGGVGCSVSSAGSPASAGGDRWISPPWGVEHGASVREHRVLAAEHRDAPPTAGPHSTHGHDDQRRWPDVRPGTPALDADLPSLRVDPERGHGLPPSTARWRIAYEPELEATQRWLVRAVQAQMVQDGLYGEIRRTLEACAARVERLEAELAAVLARIEGAERGLAIERAEACADLAPLTRSVLSALGRIAHPSRRPRIPGPG